MFRYVTLLALACAFSAFAGAKIKWDHTRHDFGAFDESVGTATAVFTLYNNGDDALIISGTRANCGCTTPRLSADIIQPGDSATLTVAYDPSGRPGRFDKKIFIDSNADPRRSVLTITGVCVGNSASVIRRYPTKVGPLRLVRPAVLLGSLKSGHVKSIFESAYNTSTDTLRPAVVDTPDWLDVTILPYPVPPGEQVSFDYYVHGDKINTWDLVTDTVTIIPDKGSSETLRVPVVLTVNEDFSNLTSKQIASAPVVRITPERLNPVTLTENGAVTSFNITNDGKSPLKIRRIYSRVDGLRFRVKPDESVKPGKTLEVKVEIPPHCLDNSNATAIVVAVITNDPLNPKSTLLIPVTR